jgi:hypothetical protein
MLDCKAEGEEVLVMPAIMSVCFKDERLCNLGLANLSLRLALISTLLLGWSASSSAQASGVHDQFEPAAHYSRRELWSNEVRSRSSSMNVTLPPHSCTLLELKP